MLTFASLFSGCGGFDLGFVQAGFKCVAAFDKEFQFLKVHENNISSGHAVCCDLTSPSAEWTELGNCDVLLAGPPCQGFSTLGKGNRDDPRNSLLLTAGEVAAAVKPSVFVLENVAGVKAGKHERFLSDLRSTLEVAGFRTKEIVCRANEHGVPQARRRIFILAWRQDKDIAAPSLPKVSGGTVADALEDADDLPNHSPSYLDDNTTAGKIAPHIAPGQKLSNVRGGERSVHAWDIPEVYGETTSRERDLLTNMRVHRRRRRVRDWGDADPLPRAYLTDLLGDWVLEALDSLIEKGYVRKVDGHYDLTRTFNGKFRRLRPDEPAPTVNTRFGDPWYFLHPYEDRGFTVREAARIQGFPDDYVFSGTQDAQYTMIGNAVPPPLGKAVAEYLKRELLDGDDRG